MEQPREVTWSTPDHCLWIPNMLTMALACPYDDNKVNNTMLSPFYRADCSVKGNVLHSIIITPLSQRYICIVPFYRWENGGMESWSHLTAFLMQELWEVGLQPSAANSNQMLLLPFELPKGSILRSQRSSRQEVCACMWLWPWDGSVHIDWETHGAGKRGENQKRRVRLYGPGLSGLTLVTEGWRSIRMICVSHVSRWKHPEHWWLWRVHPVGRQVVAEDINVRETPKIILFFRQKCTVRNRDHCMYVTRIP